MNTDRLYQLIVPLLRCGAAGARRRRLESFTAAPGGPGHVVFLGDSITEGGDWQRLFPELPTLNRGIGWDTTQDVLARLDEAIDHPVAVSILIGTNDLHTSRLLKDPAGIAIRLEEIVQRIKRKAPEAKIVINGLTPRTPYFAPRIQDLNARYQEIARRAGSDFVDTWPALADDDGGLRKELTRDNLHLTEAGYDYWVALLRPHLARGRAVHNLPNETPKRTEEGSG